MTFMVDALGGAEPQSGFVPFVPFAVIETSVCGDPLGAGLDRAAGATRAEGERHRAVAHNLAVHSRRAAQHAHAAAEPLDVGFDLDDVAWVDRLVEADPLDAHEENQLFA